MSVPIQYIAAATILSALSSTTALAGGCCGSTGGNGITNIPTVQGPSGGCCGPATSHIVGVPTVYVPAPTISVGVGGANIGGNNVYVGGNTYGGNNVSVGGNTYIGGGSSSYFGSSGGGVYYGGGGGGYSNPSPTTPGLIEALNVGGGQAAAMEQYQESRTLTETVAIRAVCMDDRGMPHPASRTDGEANIGSTFNGEVFRCMAGTRMEVTIGKVVGGQAVFDGGRTISCQKGQALAYTNNGSANGAAGASGNVVCVAQQAKADCNERSLLRRFGPGIKYAMITRTESFTASRQSSSQQAMTFRSSMFVDGGVGQGVY